jgi:hypothetical protein
VENYCEDLRENIDVAESWNVSRTKKEDVNIINE